MAGQEFRLFRKRDLLVFLAAVLIAALGFLSWIPRGDAAPVAVIEQNGQELRRIDLSRVTETEEIHLGGDIPVTIQVGPGEISIAESACPDQICVNTGVLTRPGQSAVCLPSRVAVRMIGEDTNGGLDATTG